MKGTTIVVIEQSRRARFKGAVGAKVRGDEVWVPEPEREATPGIGIDLYGSMLLAAAGVGIGVYFGCDHWHATWAHLSLSDLARKGPEPLAAQYPWLSAIVATLIAFVLMRFFVFMHRLESR